MDINRISCLTGLSIEDAKRSANRQYGEPLLWKGSVEQRDDFIAYTQKQGAHPLLGGRFLHIWATVIKAPQCYG